MAVSMSTTLLNRQRQWNLERKLKAFNDTENLNLIQYTG